MKVRNYIGILGSVAGLGLGVFYLLFEWHLGKPWSRPHHANGEIWAAKSLIAARAERPTIWLQGGSATWFGYDSELISQETGYSVMNLGFHASLPLDFMLENVQAVAKSGDVVVLSLEYDIYWRSRYNTYAVEELSVWNPDYFRSRTWGRKLDYLKAHSWAKVWAGLLVAQAEGRKGRIDALYAPEREELLANLEGQWAEASQESMPAYYNYLNCSPRGDFNYSEPRSWHGIDGYDLMTPHEGLSGDFVDDLTAFSEWCNSSGVGVFMTWPNLAENDGLDISTSVAQKNLDQVRTFFWELKLTTLGAPERMVWPAEFFYDTSYHLNRIGRNKRTKLLLRMIEMGKN